MLIRRSSEVSDRLRASSLRRSPSCSSAQKYDVLLSMVDNFRPAGVQWSTFIGRPLKSDWFKVLGSFCRICLGSPRSSTISRREAPLRWLHLQPSHIVHKPCPSTCTHHTSPLEVSKERNGDPPAPVGPIFREDGAKFNSAGLLHMVFQLLPRGLGSSALNSSSLKLGKSSLGSTS